MGGEHWGSDTSEPELIAAAHAALDAGVNWFDTAPLYGRGRAESLLGRALSGRDAIIATKAGVADDGPHVYSAPTHARVVADCEASLRRLRRSCIDLLQLHWAPDRGTPLEEGIRALVDLQSQGKIRHFGFCNYAPAQLTAVRGLGPLSSLQTPYSLLRREFEQGGLRDASAGIGVLAYETLCRGLLTGKFRRVPTFPETDMRRRDPRFSGPRFYDARRLLDDLSAVGRRVGAPVSALSIGWVLRQPGVTAAIVGMKRPSQVEENLRCVPLLGRRRLWSVIGRLAALHEGGLHGPAG